MDSERCIQEIQREFPDFRLIPKSGHELSRWVDRVLRLVTLGRQDRYLSEYHTVLGGRLYVPESWASASDVERVIILRHERVHLRQRRRLGRFWMAFLYLVPFVPVGLAYGRARLEWEAYEETLRATAELKGLDAARDPALFERILGRFTGPDYGWMWPFPGQVRAWYERALERLEREIGETRTERAGGGQ